MSVPAVTLCLNLLWLIGRTGLFNSFGYMSLKLSRATHFSTFKQKIKVTAINCGLDEVENFQQYNEYVAHRQECTKK